MLQLFSFFCFMLVALRFLHRVRTREPHTWAKDAALPWHRDWRTLLCVLLVSSVGILVRLPPFPPFLSFALFSFTSRSRPRRASHTRRSGAATA